MKRSRRKSESAAVLAQLLHEKQREEKLAETLDTLPLGAPLPVIVSRLERAYVPFVDHLHKSSFPIKYGAEYFDSALQSAPWAKVALWDGCVVGAVICKVSDEFIGTIHVRTLVSKVRRRKIASQLLEAVFAEALELGFSKTSLYVHVKNDGAIAFYKSLGYEVNETRINFYSTKAIEEPRDAFLMVRHLRSPKLEEYSINKRCRVIDASTSCAKISSSEATAEVSQLETQHDLNPSAEELEMVWEFPVENNICSVDIASLRWNVDAFEGTSPPKYPCGADVDDGAILSACEGSSASEVSVRMGLMELD